MSPSPLHEAVLSAILPLLEAGKSLLVTGGFGLGKTAFAVTAARAASGGDAPLRCMAADPSSFADLVGADPREAPETIALAIAHELAGSRVLVIDDAPLLDVAGERVVELLLRRHQARVIVTSRAVPTGSAILDRLSHEDVLHRVDLVELDAEDRERVVRDALVPADVDREVVERVVGLCGGVPRLLAACVAELRRTGAIRIIDEIAIWDDTAPVSMGLGDAVAAVMDASGLQVKAAGETIAFGGPQPVSALAHVHGEASLRLLHGAFPLRRFTVADVEHVTFLHEGVAIAIREHAGRQRAAEVLASTAPTGDEWRSWPEQRLRRHLVLAVENGVAPPLELAEAVLGGRAPTAGEPSLLFALSALIEHPDATLEARLRSLTARAATRRLARDLDGARLDIERGLELSRDRVIDDFVRMALVLEHAETLRATGAEPLAVARMLDDAAVDVGLAAGTRLRAWAVAALGVRAREIHESSQRMLAETAPVDALLPLAAPAVLVLAQRGEHARSQALAERMFVTAMQHMGEQPGASSDIVAASIFAHFICGESARAAEKVRELRMALAMSADPIPVHDASLGQIGEGLVLVAAGSWSDSVAPFRPAAARYRVHDPLGVGGIVHSWLARSLAASGSVDAARDAIREGYYRSGQGASAYISLYCETLLLQARIWLGDRVVEQALDLADRAHEQELALIEVMALHTAVLSDRAAVPDGIEDRADALAQGIEAPVARGLVDHLREMRDGSGDDRAMRELARQGIILPAPSPEESLTQREREIATLASLGYPAKTIADRFVLSKRTVDTHLNRIYAKLGISGRDELEAALRR